MSLLEQGVDVSRTDDRFREGLLIWEGTWLHQLVSRGFVLRREWFADADSVCICASEHVKESILDHALRAETSWNVKIYNIVTLSFLLSAQKILSHTNAFLVPLRQTHTQKGKPFFFVLHKSPAQGAYPLQRFFRSAPKLIPIGNFKILHVDFFALRRSLQY